MAGKYERVNWCLIKDLNCMPVAKPYRRTHPDCGKIRQLVQLLRFVMLYE